jgi:hypothetical protein
MNQENKIKNFSKMTLCSGLAVSLFINTTGCIKKQESEQKSLRNTDTGELLFENIVLSDTEALIDALEGTNPVGKMPVCYFKTGGIEGSPTVTAVTTNPILFSDALDIFSGSGAQFDIASYTKQVNSQILNFINSVQSTDIVLYVPNSSAIVPTTQSNLNENPSSNGAVELSLVGGVGMAKLLVGSKLTSLKSMKIILSTIKKVLDKKFVNQQAKKSQFVSLKLAGVLEKLSSKIHKKTVYKRALNIKNIKEKNLNLVPGPKKFIMGLGSTIMQMLAWTVIPTLLTEVYNNIKKSKFPNKSPTEAEIVKEIESMPPEELETVVENASENTEKRISASKNLLSKISEASTAINDILLKNEIQADNAVFTTAEASIIRRSTEAPYSATPCAPEAQSALVPQPAE